MVQLQRVQSSNEQLPKCKTKSPWYPLALPMQRSQFAVILRQGPSVLCGVNVTVFRYAVATEAAKLQSPDNQQPVLSWSRLAPQPRLQNYGRLKQKPWFECAWMAAKLSFQRRIPFIPFCHQICTPYGFHRKTRLPGQDVNSLNNENIISRGLLITRRSSSPQHEQKLIRMKRQERRKELWSA